MRKKNVMWLCAISIVSFFALVIPTNTSAYTTHDPIYIEGNDDFTPENGVTGGTGTQSDPYIIEGCSINASSADGIEIRNTDAYFIVRNCYVHDGGGSHNGIYLYNVTNGRVENTNLFSNKYGIWLGLSSNNTVSNNTASNSYFGIGTGYSKNNTIFNNRVNSNNYCGIRLSYSSYSTMTNNTLENNGIFIEGDTISHFNAHDIDTTNTANGKPIYYYKNCKNINIDGWSAGQMILANCTNFIVNNVDCSNASIGMQLAYCDGCSIENSVFNNGTEGIRLHSSSRNNMLSNNSASNNNYGFWLEDSSYNTLFNNRVNSSNNEGISLYDSSNNTIFNNNASNNGGDGIYMVFSNYNTVSNNDASNNGDCGIYLHHSSNNYISKNDASNNNEGINLYGSSDNNNIFNNSATHNWYGIHLSSSSNNNILSSNSASNNHEGIWIEYSSNNNIYNNSVNSNSRYGIFLWHSSNNTFVSNNISYNIWSIEIYDNDCKYNTFHHNNFISGGVVNVVSNGTNTKWDDGYGEGNYWSNYNGSDDGANGRVAGDGVGDTNVPHMELDHYPLMEPVEQPFTPTPQSRFSLFDCWWVIFLVIIIVVIIMVVVLSRRKK